MKIVSKQIQLTTSFLGFWFSQITYKDDIETFRKFFRVGVN